MTSEFRTLCFGELLLRLAAPGSTHLFQTPQLNADFGGAEANVAVALARLGKSSALVSAIPTGMVGDAALDSVRRAGVDVSHVLRSDGRMGIYFLSPGAGARAPVITYDRMGSTFTLTPSEAYDWGNILQGARWLHLSGIIPAISPEASRLSLEAMRAAKATGVGVSFDGNFRKSMWSRWCPEPGPVLAEHVALADLFFGSHRDISLILGRSFAASGQERRRDAALAAFERFPNLSHIASTSRSVLQTDHHRISARIDRPDEFFETEERVISAIVDRIGTGDCFAAGILAYLEEGLGAAAVKALALTMLNHFTPGDQSFTTSDNLTRFLEGFGDVQR